MCIYICLYTYVHIYTYIYIYIYRYMYIQTCVQMYIYIYICMCVFLGLFVNPASVLRKPSHLYLGFLSIAVCVTRRLLRQPPPLPTLIPKHCSKKPGTPEQELLFLELELWNQRSTYPVTFALQPPSIFGIRIAPASQRDHWHRYRFHFILVSTRLLFVATLRHGLLEKRKSATGGM